MKLLVYSTHKFEKPYLEKAFAAKGVELQFIETRMTAMTASLAKGYKVICLFVHDKVDASTAKQLKEEGVELILLRSAGFNNVDLVACNENGIRVCRVPEYSPYSVAEFTVALLQSLNRKIYRAVSRVREFNFSLDHLVGFDLHEKNVGVIGTGKIGAQVCRILHGFGCNVFACDKEVNEELKGVCTYLPLDELIKKSQIVSLHVPLNKETHHLIDEERVQALQEGAILINTGRGGLIDSKALVKALKSGHLGGAALDVYEEEENVFFVDHSFEVLKDDVLARLLTFPNVIITAHQAFLTEEALGAIADTTEQSFYEFMANKELSFEVKAEG